MTERINLDVSAALSSLSTIRRVLGGLGARLGYSLDDIDDLYLSTEQVVRTALSYERPERVRLEILVAADNLHIEIGAFASPVLRDELTCDGGQTDVVDLACLLRRTVDDVAIDARPDGSYNVVLVRRHRRSLS